MRKPRIGERLRALNIGMTVDVTINIMRVSSLAPVCVRERVRLRDGEKVCESEGMCVSERVCACVCVCEIVGACVFVCACVRERERKRGREWV